ncbi:exodeoxyribonuclease III, partial [Candidatus Shapirobacteria bacterium CG08_land_8_20_14_0_20_39_18]
MKLISWNVNGLRSAEVEFIKFINDQQPDVIMIQELRAEPNQLSMFLCQIPDYKKFFNPSG